MAITLYAHNVLDAFSSQDRTDEYLQIIHKQDPDIVIFTEAYKEDSETSISFATDQLERQGYAVLSGAYDDSDGRQDKHGILLAVRRKLLNAGELPRLGRPGGRNFAECRIADGSRTIHFIGMHMNDRSEAKRQAELDDLLLAVDAENVPTIIAGDLNTMHHTDARGKAFRKARLIHALVALKVWPKSEPKGVPEPNTFARKGSLYFRKHEMAGGKTLERLENAGFMDADSGHQPTYPADSPAMQLDHIMLSPHFTVRTFTVLPAGSSDHLGIVATVAL